MELLEVTLLALLSTCVMALVVRVRSRKQVSIFAARACSIVGRRRDRATELQLLPHSGRNFEAELYSPLVGMTRAGREVLRSCRVLDPVRLVKVSQNGKGGSAVAVLTETGEKLGYLPQYCSAQVSADVENGTTRAVLWQIEISELCMEATVLLRRERSEPSDAGLLHNESGALERDAVTQLRATRPQQQG